MPSGGGGFPAASRRWRGGAPRTAFAVLVLVLFCSRAVDGQLGGFSLLGNVGKVCSVQDDTKNCGEGYTCGPCLQKPNVKEATSDKECQIGRDGECQPCSQGDYCPAGSKNPLAWTGMHMCPPGDFCPNSTAKESCRPGSFCPSGAFTYDGNLTGFDLDCPVGKGLYCGNGSKTFLNPCPKGFYCPVPAEIYDCPGGHFCKEYSLEPTKCQFGTYCPGGSKAPGVSYLGVICTLLAVGVMQLTFRMIMWKIKLVEKKNSSDSAETKKISETTRTVMSKLLSIPAYALPELVSGFTPKSVPVTIEFITLGLHVGEKIIIKSISGKFQESRLTAVMGPSGCGKSSLLNTVSARATYGTTTGTILINGQQRPIKTLERVMAFVPQDDTVFGELTVRENLRYSAQLRLSASQQHMDQALIGGVIQVLGMTHIQNSVVGSVEKRGISGGQKKRVNIGMELVADPTLVFLDEPTSGLGATDTLIVMKGLKSMAFLRRTVVAVIHQPRYEVFTLFHQVLLLGVGGNTVFMGDSRQALPYFERIGFKLPPNENPADYFMDVIAGHAERTGDVKFKPDHLFGLWDDNGHTVVEEEMVPSSTVQLPQQFIDKMKAQWDKMDQDGGGSIQAAELQPLLEDLGTPITDEEAEMVLTVLDEDGSGEIEFEEFLQKATNEYSMMKTNVRAEVPEEQNVGEGKPDSFKQRMKAKFSRRGSITTQRMNNTPAEQVGFRQLPSMFEQYERFCHRGSTQWIRSFDSVIIYDVMLMVGASLAVGVILGADWDYPDIPRNALLSTVTIGVLTVVSSLKIFGQEKVMIARESKTGVNLLAYFLGKCSVALIDNVWQPSLFLAVYFSLTMPRVLFFHYWYILIVNTYACHGIGIFMSVMMHPTNALLAGVIFPLVTGVFLGGVDPRLADMSPVMKIASGLSFARWTAECVTIAELESEPDYQMERIDIMYEKLGYNPDNYWINLIALFVMGLGFRALAYISLAGGFQAFIKDVFMEMGNLISDSRSAKKVPMRDPQSFRRSSDTFVKPPEAIETPLLGGVRSEDGSGSKNTSTNEHDEENPAPSYMLETPPARAKPANDRTGWTPPTQEGSNGIDNEDDTAVSHVEAPRDRTTKGASRATSKENGHAPAMSRSSSRRDDGANYVRSDSRRERERSGRGSRDRPDSYGRSRSRRERDEREVDSSARDSSRRDRDRDEHGSRRDRDRESSRRDRDRDEGRRNRDRDRDEGRSNGRSDSRRDRDRDSSRRDRDRERDRDGDSRRRSNAEYAQRRGSTGGIGRSSREAQDEGAAAASDLTSPTDRFRMHRKMMEMRKQNKTVVERGEGGSGDRHEAYRQRRSSASARYPEEIDIRVDSRDGDFGGSRDGGGGRGRDGGLRRPERVRQQEDGQEWLIHDSAAFSRSREMSPNTSGSNLF